MKLISINEIGILPAVGENSGNDVVPQLNTVFGVQVDDVFSVGIGTGVKFVPIGFGERYTYPHIPFVLDLRFYMGKQKHIPFLATYAGYAVTTYTKLPDDFPFFDYVWGGLVFGGGLGYRYQITEKLGVNLSFGYQAQQNHFSDPKISGYTHQLALNLGVNLVGKNRLE